MYFKRILTLAVALLAGHSINADAEGRGLQVTDYATKMLNAVNNMRTPRGLNPVCINEKLASVAQSLAQDMALTNNVSSEGLYGSTSTSRFETAGLNVTSYGVLLNSGDPNIDHIVAMWGIYSSSLIYMDFQFIGPGYAYNETQEFQNYYVLYIANATDAYCSA